MNNLTKRQHQIVKIIGIIMVLSLLASFILPLINLHEEL